MNYYSQSQQDKIVDILFSKKMNGFFVDIGAHNGVNFSNSLFFEKYRDWKGVCIEPIPEVFEELEKNRNCHLINGVISDSKEILEFKRVHGYGGMLSGILKYREKLHDERTDSELEKYDGFAEIISIQSYTLKEILDKIGTQKVDYLSLDIEGGEFEVLQSINFKELDITCLTVENNYNADEPRKYMKKNGYLLLKIAGHSDDFYFKKDKVNYLIKWKFAYYKFKNRLIK